MRMLLVVVALAALSSACARRGSPPATEGVARASRGFFLTTSDPPLLVPPEAGTAAVRAEDPEACPPELGGISIERGQGRIHVEIDAERLRGGPAGWLGLWAVGLERLGCLSVGDGYALARRLANSAPLPLGRERKLLEVSEGRDGYLDLRAGHRLRTVRPVFREGAPEGRSAIDEVGETRADSPGSLTLEIRVSDDLIGYERAWYEFVPAGTNGARLRPLEAVAVLDGEESVLPKPLDDWMGFGDEARHFRLLFLSRRTEEAENDILLLGRSSPVALEDLTQQLRAEPDTCAQRPGCKRAPLETAILPFITATVDGKTVVVAPGSTVRGALSAAGQSTEAIADLRVWKATPDGLTAVKYEDGRAILDLPLLGGERLWTKEYTSKSSGAAEKLQRKLR